MLARRRAEQELPEPQPATPGQVDSSSTRCHVQEKHVDQPRPIACTLHTIQAIATQLLPKNCNLYTYRFAASSLARALYPTELQATAHKVQVILVGFGPHGGLQRAAGRYCSHWHRRRLGRNMLPFGLERGALSHDSQLGGWQPNCSIAPLGASLGTLGSPRARVSPCRFHRPRRHSSSTANNRQLTRRNESHLRQRKESHPLHAQPRKTKNNFHRRTCPAACPHAQHLIARPGDAPAARAGANVRPARHPNSPRSPTTEKPAGRPSNLCPQNVQRLCNQGFNLRICPELRLRNGLRNLHSKSWHPVCRRGLQRDRNSLRLLTRKKRGCHR